MKMHADVEEEPDSDVAHSGSKAVRDWATFAGRSQSTPMETVPRNLSITDHS